MSTVISPRKWWSNVDRTQTLAPEPEVKAPMPRSLDAIWDQIKRRSNHKVQLQCQLAKIDTELDDLRKSLVNLLVEIDREDQIFKGTALRMTEKAIER